MTDSSTKEIFSMLSSQELAIAALYATFSKTLPEMKQFWDDLVMQEKAHSDVMVMLAELIESNNVHLNKQLFNITAIQTNIDHIKKYITKLSAEGATPRQALAKAVDIEKSLIEAGYFRIIETDLPQIQKELKEIENHTKQHAAMIEKRLNELKENHPMEEQLWTRKKK